MITEGEGGRVRACRFVRGMKVGAGVDWVYIAVVRVVYCCTRIALTAGRVVYCLVVVVVVCSRMATALVAGLCTVRLGSGRSNLVVAAVVIVGMARNSLVYLAAVVESRMIVVAAEFLVRGCKVRKESMGVVRSRYCMLRMDEASSRPLLEEGSDCVDVLQSIRLLPLWLVAQTKRAWAPMDGVCFANT